MYSNITAHNILIVGVTETTNVPDAQGVYSRRLEITDNKGDVMTLTLFAKTQSALEIKELSDVE